MLKRGTSGFLARSSLPWLAASIVLLLFLLVRTVFSPFWPINHDCAMYVAVGQLVLQGKIPYVDFIDLNPPLIFYLSTLPALLSQLTALAPDKSFAILTWLFCAAEWATTAILLQSKKDRDYNYAGPLLFGFAAFNFFVGEWGEFGQRQHLVAVALVPFFMLRWIRSKRQKVRARISITIGLLAGLMLALVPQYVIIPAAVEVLFQKRKFNIGSLIAPEVVAALGCGIAYGVLFFLLPASARDAFLHRWMPLTVHGYAAYNAGWQSFTVFPFTIGILPLLFIGAGGAWRYRSTLSFPLLVFCAASYLVVLMQLKGWYNHYLPLFAGVILLTTVQVETWMQRTKPNQSGFNKIAMAAILLSACCFPSILLRESFDYPQGELETLGRETRPGDRVIVLSTSVADIYPALLEAQCVNGSRYLFYFPIEMLRFQQHTAKTATERANAQNEQKRVLAEIVEDVKASKPKLILIPAGISQMERDNSMVKYFQGNGLLDLIKEHFALKGECRGRKTSFEIWKRLN